MFKDKENELRIMAETNPSKQKQFGRKVQGFNEEIWGKESLNIVKNGNMAKFTQNPTLKEELMKTYPKILAESSPSDCVWGIGLREDCKEAWNLGNWRGKNLLGFTLMEVRHVLMS